MNILMIVFAVILLIYSAFLFLVSNLNLGTIMVAGLGVFFLILGIFFKPLRAACKSGIMRAVKWAVIAVFCLEGALVGFIAAYGQFDNADYKEDAVIVLGAGVHGEFVSWPLMERLETAIRYHEKNPDALIVVTGGKGYQESITEALAMERYLLGRGVEPDKIVKEEEATSTNENMRFSKKILDERLGGDYRIAVVTNNFHIYRGTQIAINEGFKSVTHLHAKLQWYNLLPCYLRETAAVLKLWAVG